jgi:hypothetical protein
MVGEKSYPLRIPLELYEEIKRLAEREERSANWMMIRLLREAVAVRERNERPT